MERKETLTLPHPAPWVIEAAGNELDPHGL